MQIIKFKNGESNVWCKTDGEKEDRGLNGDVGIEGNSGSDSKSEWSEMVWACVEEGWWTYFEKSVGVWRQGIRKRGQPRKTWKMQVEKESRSVRLKKEDALNRARWRVEVGEVSARVG